MRYFFFIILAVLFLSGCACYSFRKGDSPYDQGFVAARYDRVIPEYTLGKDNSVPTDEQLARERFKRRRKAVEHYYKKMGYIENRFKQNFIDPPIFILKTTLGMLYMPGIAISDYKYNHNPKYREKVDQKEDAEYKAGRERLNALKAQLSAYIQEDLQKEASIPTSQPQAAVQKKVKPLKEAKKEAKEKPPVEEQKEFVPETPVAQLPAEEKTTSAAAIETKTLAGPLAVIIAKPTKGFSPLRVQFSAAKSSSPNGKIISYVWDFGDGDSSTQKNPVNTYWSVTYGSRSYTVALTVKDEKGLSSQANTIIEVLTK